MKDLIPAERIEQKIYLVRGQKVMLDYDLAELYQVKTKNLNKAVKRNVRRFPKDFRFQLNKEETEDLRFQFGTSNLKSQFATSKRGGRRYLPFVFTEQGVAMLSSVLNSERAIQVNIAIMRAFVKLRQILSTHKELASKLNELEQRVSGHDGEIRTIFEAIRQLMLPPDKPKRKIGFLADREQ